MEKRSNLEKQTDKMRLSSLGIKSEEHAHTHTAVGARHNYGMKCDSF